MTETRIEIDADGGINTFLPVLSSVGLTNLADIISHDINRIAGSTSHVVRLRGGGCLQFAYNDQGELIELTGHRINAHVTAEGAMLVAAYAPPSHPSTD